MLKNRTYINQILQNSAAFLTIAMVINYLSPEEVVLWYIYTTLLGATIVFELGLSTQITRYYAQGLAGAKEISDAEPKYTNIEEPNNAICSDIAEYGKITFKIISALCITVSLAYLIISFDRNLAYMNGSLIRLHIFNLGTLLSAYVSMAFNYQSAIEIANGNGEKLVEYLTRSKIFIIISAAFILVAGLGIEYVVIINLFGLTYYRLKVYLSYRQTEKHNREGIRNGVLKTSGKLIRNTTKQIQASAGNFLANRSSVLIAANNLDAKDAMLWGLITQVTTAALAISQLPIQLSVRTLVRASKEELKSYLKKTHQVYALLSVFILVIFIALLKSGIIEGGLELIAIMLLVKWLELNHSNACTILSYKNHMKFYSASLLSGGAITALTLSLPIQDCFTYALIIFLIQLSYNNWKWPLVLRQELK